MTGVHNPKVKLAVALTQRKYRERHGLILIEGERLIRRIALFWRSDPITSLRCRSAAVQSSRANSPTPASKSSR